MKLLECVPNVSEGRDASVIQALSAEIRSEPEVHLLDVSSDADHHRTVLSFAGPAEPVGRAALRLAKTCARNIDLTTHQGIHPRLGALDVVPFIPLGGASVDEAVQTARRLGREIGKLGIPVLLYEKAASGGRPAALPEIRRGGLEGIEKRMESSDWRPDFGPGMPHPTAGATVVGVRDILIAFNVVLDSGDLRLARSIARTVRESTGGLPAVRALGLLLESHPGASRQKRAQVSMNLLDFRRTPPWRAFEAIRGLAERAGVAVAETEVVGLIPEAAFEDRSPEELQLASFRPEQVLERALEAAGLPVSWESAR